MTDQSNLPVHLLLDLDISVIDRIQQVTEAMERYNTMWLLRNWDDLIQYASHLSGLAEVIGHQIASRAVVGGLVRDKLGVRDAMTKAFYAEIRDSDSVEALEAKEKLLEELTEELGNPIEAQDELDSLLNGEGALFKQASQFSSRFNDEEELLIEAFARLRSMMINAESIGLFQKSVRQTRLFNEKLKNKIDEFPGISLDKNDTDAIAEQVELMKSSVDNGYSRIFNALRDQVPIEELSATAAAVYQETGPVGGLIGRLLGSYLALAQVTDDLQVRQTQLQMALEAAEWQSRIGLLHIYTAYIRANTQSRDVNRWYSFEKKRVETRDLASAVPQGTSVSIEQIIQDASLSIGEMFQLEGLVANLRIEDDPGPPKFSSFFELTDPVSGTVVKVRAHLFSLLNNGVSDGAYCRLNGFLRRNEPWLENGSVGIDIDRVNLTELRKASWNDDITHRMRSFYTLYFDQMNMFFTPNLEDNLL